MSLPTFILAQVFEIPLDKGVENLKIGLKSFFWSDFLIFNFLSLYI